MTPRKLSIRWIPRLTLGLGLALGCAGQLIETPPASPRIEIRLASGTRPEAQTREQLLRLLRAHRLEPWTITGSIIIDERAIPHSHPVLTLHARHLNEDDQLLSTFIHEQCHWHMNRHAAAVERAVAELRHRYPRVPVGYPEGAQSERSSYEHLVICWLEIDGLRQLVGPERARQTLEFWARDHYRWVYRTLFGDAAEIGELVRRHGLQLPTAIAAAH